MSRLRSLAEACAVLGLPPEATRADIVRAYRRLARLTHPDSSASVAGPEQFRLVTDAYRTAMSEAVVLAPRGAGSPMVNPGPAPEPPTRSDRPSQEEWLWAGPTIVEPLQPLGRTYRGETK